MNPAIETFLRVVLSSVAVAILGVLANMTNLSGVIPAQWAPIVAALATSALAALDAHNSPAGTVAFGSFGKAR